MSRRILFRMTGSAETAPRRRRWWRLLLLSGAAVLSAVELHGRLPSASSTWSVLHRAEWGWLLAAVALQVVSMSAFAEQQRSLLAAFGVRMPARASLATSYVRTAMATALPAGEALSAAYAFRQFRGRGASRPIAAAVTLLTAVGSILGLAAAYAGDLLFWVGPAERLAVAGGVLVLVLLAWRLMPRPTSRTAAVEVRDDRNLLGRVRRTLHETVLM